MQNIFGTIGSALSSCVNVCRNAVAGFFGWVKSFFVTAPVTTLIVHPQAAQIQQQRALEDQRSFLMSLLCNTPALPSPYLFAATIDGMPSLDQMPTLPRDYYKDSSTNNTNKLPQGPYSPERLSRLKDLQADVEAKNAALARLTPQIS